jgi:pyrroloquinoline quinone biosynthesis protein D
MPSTPTPPDAALYPKLAAHARLQHDRLTGATMLLYPEGALVLDAAAQAIAERCDGFRTVDAISSDLALEFEGDPLVIAQDVRDCLTDLAERGLVHLHARPA